MADDKEPVVPVAPKADLTNGGAVDTAGNPVPPAPDNKPPVTEPTAEEAAAAKEAADKEAAAKAEAANADAEHEAKDKPLDRDVWGSTGSDVGDSVLGLLQNSGLEVGDPVVSSLYDAVRNGDLSTVDTAALEKAVGKNTANLVMVGAKGFMQEAANANTAILAEVHKAAGGKDVWDKVSVWAKQSDAVSAEAITEYAAMIDNGGAQARFATAELTAAYNADPNNTTVGGTPLQQGDTPANLQARATTRAEYVAELDKAHRNGASQSTIDEITAARHNGRKQQK